MSTRTAFPVMTVLAAVAACRSASDRSARPSPVPIASSSTSVLAGSAAPVQQPAPSSEIVLDEDGAQRPTASRGAGPGGAADDDDVAPGPAIFGASDELVYFTSNPDTRWATGAPILLRKRNTDSAWTAERNVNTARLAPGYRGWIYKSMRVLAEGGEPCEAHVVELRIRASTIPRASDAMRWSGEERPAPSRAEIASEVWDGVRPEERWLVGRLDTTCPGGLWATDGPAPELFEARAVDGELEADALRRFRALTEYEKLQQRFEKRPGRAAARWEDADGRIQVRGFGPKDGVRVVVVSVSTPSAALSARFDYEARTTSTAPLRSQVLGQYQGASPRSAFDLDGNGSLELLTGPDGDDNEVALWWSRHGKSRSTVLQSMLNRDCPY